MAIRKDIVWTVGADGFVSPTTPQDGGVQGEHNATRVIFRVGTGSVWENPAYTVYIECEDNAGNIDTTEPLAVEDGQVAVLLPQAWTQYGGMSTLRLVAEEEDGTIAYTAEGRVRFDSRQNASQKVDGLLKGRMAEVEKRVNVAASAAGNAAQAAQQAAEGATKYALEALAAARDAENSYVYAEEEAVKCKKSAQQCEAHEKKVSDLISRLTQSGESYIIYEIEGYSIAVSDEQGNVAYGVKPNGEKVGFGDGSGTSVATTFDYTKCGLPVLYLNGDVSEMTKKNAVQLKYKLVTRKAPFYNGGIIASGVCDCKWQGSSSVRNEYAKRNYTIEFDTAFEATSAVSKRSGDPADDQESEFGSKRERKWGAQNKYCLKANWIDPSGVRNVVNAKLWGDIVRSRAASKIVSSAPAQLSAAPNGGAIDGFPCIIAIKGEFEGLYTFNIPKEGWLFGMGESLTEYVVAGEENGLAACGFYSEPTFVEDENEKVDFSVEYKHDDVAEETVVASFKAAVNRVKDAPKSAEWETYVAPYFDIDSAIDYYIFICCINAHDNLRRNTLYATYGSTEDGVPDKWFISAYDLDTTYGYNPYGTCLFPVKTERTQFYEAATGSTKHRLFELIYKYSFDKLKARYDELRNGIPDADDEAVRIGILSNENVWYMLANFANRIPRAIYNLDADKFADEPDYDKYPMPGTTTANVENYTHYYRMHTALLDKEMEE